MEAISAASTQRDYEDSIKARWHGGPTVLAFLFAHPDCDAMRLLDARGDYFDRRTGATWDLFFPGYYRSTNRHLEEQTDARTVGRDYASDWFFNASDFNQLREHVEQSSEGRWQYSGEADLVLINGWLAEKGEPTIDWPSTISGQVTDHTAHARTLTLAGVIERITRDLENAAEDASYGVGQVTDPPPPPEGSIARDLMVNALGGIAAALGTRAAGL